MPAEEHSTHQGRGQRSGVGYAPHRRTTASRRPVHLARRAREKAVVRAYRAASFTLGHVPVGVSFPVARVLFLASYYAWPAKRRIIVSNASHVLGRPPDTPEVQRLARRVFQTYARYVIELMRLPALDPAVPARLVRADRDNGVESFTRLYEQLRSAGRGMIVVAAHIGHLETLAAAFAAKGWPVYGLADDSAYPELYDLLAAQRRAWGVEVIAWRNMREIFRVLRQQAILGLLVDWGYRGDGIPVRLFDEWTTLPAGPALLAARTGAAIVPVVNRRNADGTYSAAHFDPIQVEDDSPAALQRATQAIADALERMVQAAPEQWYIFKPIWPATVQEAADLHARADAARPRGDSNRPAGADRAVAASVDRAEQAGEEVHLDEAGAG